MVVVLLLAAHRLALTAQGVLQVSTDFSFLFLASVEHFPLLCIVGQGPSSLPQVNCSSKTALLDATSLPSTPTLPHAHLSAPSVFTTLPLRTYTYCPPLNARHIERSRLQLLTEFYALTFN